MIDNDWAILLNDIKTKHVENYIEDKWKICRRKNLVDLDPETDLENQDANWSFCCKSNYNKDFEMLNNRLLQKESDDKIKEKQKRKAAKNLKKKNMTKKMKPKTNIMKTTKIIKNINRDSERFQQSGLHY